MTRIGLTILVLMIVVSPTVSWAVCNIVGGKAYGDCTGVKVNTEPTPAIIVTDYQFVSGTIIGATIRAGGSLTISGISGPITVEKGGRLDVVGMVEGNVLNIGGTVSVSGIVDGTIIIGNVPPTVEIR